MRRQTTHSPAMSEKKELLTTNRKALTINLDGTRYGTIAEIGAGQEVSRIFFQVGGASGSIAKTMSAYDMTFSDAIYGKAPRYVSRERPRGERSTRVSDSGARRAVSPHSAAAKLHARAVQKRTGPSFVGWLRGSRAPAKAA